MAAQLPSPLANWFDAQGRPTREFMEWCQKIDQLPKTIENLTLGDLADVDVSGASNGEQLTYADGTWEPDTA